MTLLGVLSKYGSERAAGWTRPILRWKALNRDPRTISRRRYSSVLSLDQQYQPGSHLHGFTLQRTKRVPELELVALQLKHDVTGADYLHVARNDENNVFSIGFKTNPPDDSGVPHILEHTTLCGSERSVKALSGHLALIASRYPVRDPFFKMLRRSLSTFMNAFTASDHTFYPFSTTNKRDFYNLMSVYLDATLHPLLRTHDFAQEGWRIGPANPSAYGNRQEHTSEDRRLVFKGVVYNEMKGQTSDASYLYHARFQKHIFPSINNSGGDPSRITDLTYQQLKNFHRQNYHPSNAKILTYGNMPLDHHLREIGARLENFGTAKADKEIREPRSLENGPYDTIVEGPLDPLVNLSMQYKTSVTWLACGTSDIFEVFSLGVIASLLLDGYGSPLYRNLIEAGLGHDWSPNTGLDTSGKTAIFSIGLTGVKEADVPKVKDAVMATLRQMHQDGFDKTKVEGLLHRLELALKHRSADFGMGLMQRLQPAWFNGIDPFDALAWNDVIQTFKTRYARKNYLENLLHEYFLNDRTMSFTMRPSQSYDEDLVLEESTRLSIKLDDLTVQAGGETEARRILEQRELDLLKIQEKAGDEDIGCLPTLRVVDIPRKATVKVVRDQKINDVKVQWRETATNGLTYFRAVNMLPNLPAELRRYIPLFTDAVMRLGTRDRTMEQLEDMIKLKTGGINAAYFASTSPWNLQEVSEGLMFSGFALDQNVSTMYELLRSLILETNFDGAAAEANVKELLHSAANGAVDGIAEAGSAYARRFAEAGLTAQGRLNEETGGLSQVQLIARLASANSSGDLGEIITKLKEIQRHALTSSGALRVAITCGCESAGMNEVELGKFFESVPPKPAFPTEHSNLTSLSTRAFFPLPYQVHYTGLAVSTVPYTDPTGPVLQVLAQLLTHKHLHHEIREKGGAYGGGAYAKSIGGTFGFYSYRDPNPQNTLSIMGSAGVWARDKAWTSQDLEEAKLSVFQGIDAPQSVDDEAMTRFLHGVSNDMRQRWREQALDVTAVDVQLAADRYLVNAVKSGHLAVLGPKQEWAKPDHGWTFEDIGMTTS